MVTVTLQLTAFVAGQGDLIVSGDVPVQVRRRFNEMRLVIAAPDARAIEVDQTLLQTLARGHVWFDEWLSGKVTSLKDIAHREGLSQDYITDVIRLSFLSPQIVEDVVQGKQPPELNSRRLLKMNHLPLCWQEQAQVLDCQSAAKLPRK